MKFKTLADKANNQFVAIEENDKWAIVNTKLTLIELLDMTKSDISQLTLSEIVDGQYKEILPLQPTAYRDFMLYEKHAVDAARGFVRKYMPNLLSVVKAYEKVFKKPFPKLKPKKRYYEHPIYYMGNHLNFISEGNPVKLPVYSTELDYELEIAAVITKPLLNASIDEVNEAIGGFMILNDFSARDIQLSEMECGFGPMKTKNFSNAISSTVVSKDEIINRIDQLTVKVIINDKTIVESNTQGSLYSIQEAIAYASWEEQLHPGELFGTGTIPGCTGIENGVLLNKGDVITLKVEGIGALTNTVS